MALLNTNIKQQAIKKYDETVETAKQTLVDKVKEKIKEFVKKYLTNGTFKVSTILGAINTIKSVISAASKIFTTAKLTASTVKASSLGPAEQIKETIKQAAETYKNTKLNSVGIDVDNGLNKKVGILATVDPEVKADGSDAGLHLKFQGAKVKLNSINELVDVIKNINKKLNSEDVSSTREWVHKIIHTHPLVDKKIKDLEYFKPISNETGSTYLMHTPDTQSLALGDWATELPKPFRRTLEYKIDSNIYSGVSKIYSALNSGMSRNISTEFFYEIEEDALKDQGNNYLNKQLLSNDYHIAGDYTFSENHLGLIEQILMTLLIANVGGAGKLINWLNPVNTYDIAMSGGIIINVEGNDVVVNLKGDKIGVIATIIDDKPISALK